jgi:hypothetical protein
MVFLVFLELLGLFELRGRTFPWLLLGCGVKPSLFVLIATAAAMTTA